MGTVIFIGFLSIGYDLNNQGPRIPITLIKCTDLGDMGMVTTGSL